MKINSRINPKDMTNQHLQNNFVKKISGNFLDSQISSLNILSKDKDKWNFINEGRNDRQIQTLKSCWKNSFRESITDQKRIADLLIQCFSELEECFGLSKPFIDQSSDDALLSKKFSSFPIISLFECRKYNKSLNINKPLGPSKIQA